MPPLLASELDNWPWGRYAWAQAVAGTSAVHFKIYGGDHSPWVQAVLLGLHEQGLGHSLTGVPPWRLLAKSGVVMPAASIDGGPWQLESSDILARAGYQPVSREERRALHAAWQGVAHRADRPLGFLNAFSKIRELHANPLVRLARHFLRGFSALYFMTLLRVFARPRFLPGPSDYGEQFLYWQGRLAEKPGPFLGGEAPATADLLLFGIVQCHCSIPTPPLQALRQDPRLAPLRAWVAQMNRRFADYPHLYSGRHFAPSSPAPQPATALERAAFWAGTATFTLLFPITLPLILYLIARVPR